MSWQPDILFPRETALSRAAAPEGRCRRAGDAALRWREFATTRWVDWAPRRCARVGPGAVPRNYLSRRRAWQRAQPCRPLGMFVFAPFTAQRLPNPVRAACSRPAVAPPFARCGAGAQLCCARGPAATAPCQSNCALGADFWRAAAPVRGPMVFATLQMPLLERSCDERCGARRSYANGRQLYISEWWCRARARRRIGPHCSARAAAEAVALAQVG